jgi:hypothetical protein
VPVWEVVCIEWPVFNCYLWRGNLLPALPVAEGSSG